MVWYTKRCKNSLPLPFAERKIGAAQFCKFQKHFLSHTSNAGHYICCVNIKNEYFSLDDGKKPKKVTKKYVEKNVRLLAWKP